MRLDRVRHRDVLGRQEPEPLGQHRIRHLGQLPYIELHPGPVVGTGFRVERVPVRGDAGTRPRVRGLDRQQPVDVAGHIVVPVEDLGQQLRLVRVHLPDQVGRLDLEDLAVAARDPVGQVHPRPRGQLAVGEPQPVPPELVERVEVLGPDPGQQCGHPLGQALHQPELGRAKLAHRG
jgi:hypothetical protein